MKTANWLSELAASATPNIDECVDVLGDTIDLLHLLKSTEQDAQWHAEGNVHTHTGMVLKQLYALLANEARHIQGWRRQAIILSAILHDVAKPLRTQRFELDGVERVGAPQHAFYGRSCLAFKLPELALSFRVIWTVLNLVGEHHTPKRLVVKDRPYANFHALARQADSELLYWLEVADMRGRICPDLDVQLQYLEEYRMFAQDCQVWSGPLDIRTALAPALEKLPDNVQNYVYACALRQLETGKISMAEEALATTYQHRQHHPHLVVLCGPGGSGKSSWLAQNYPDYTVISLDKYREQFNGDRESQSNKGQIMQYAKEQLRIALRSKGGVVWDATNLRTDFRSVVCGLGMDYHALVTLVVFLLPARQLYTNNRSRTHSVADSVLRKQLDNYQFPLLSEAHQFQVINMDGKTQFRSGYFRQSVDGFCE